MEIKNFNDLLKSLATIIIFITTIGLGLYSMSCMLEHKCLYAIISFIGFLFMMPISEYLLNKLNREL